MKKRCTNPSCRKYFNADLAGNACPYCGKEYPRLHNSATQPDRIMDELCRKDHGKRMYLYFAYIPESFIAEEMERDDRLKTYLHWECIVYNHKIDTMPRSKLFWVKTIKNLFSINLLGAKRIIDSHKNIVVAVGLSKASLERDCALIRKKMDLLDEETLDSGKISLPFRKIPVMMSHITYRFRIEDAVETGLSPAPRDPLFPENHLYLFTTPENERISAVRVPERK